MGSAYIPKYQLDVSTATVTPGTTDPILLLEVNGVIYPNGYRVNDPGGGYRIFTAGYRPSYQSAYVICQSFAGTIDLPAITLNNVYIHVFLPTTM